MTYCVIESGLLAAAMTAHELQEEAGPAEWRERLSVDAPVRPATCEWTLQNALEDRAYTLDELVEYTGFARYTLGQSLKRLEAEGVATRARVMEPRPGQRRAVDHWRVRRAVVECALADCMRTQLGA